MAARSRTVLVTGCSSGFGLGLAGTFLEAGWRVLATLRDAAARRSLLGALSARHPGRLTVLSLDVAARADRAAAVVDVETRGTGLDCLVNNAGYGLFGAFEETSEAQIRRQLEVNLLGAILLTRELLPALRAARGRVITVSSVFGRTGFPLAAVYCASKFALEGWSEALAHELRPHGVQVALVEPGGHATAFAANAVWGETHGRPGSPYAPQSAGIRGLHARLAARQRPPDPVVQAVLRLAGRARMPLRTRVGADARLLHVVTRLLPERLAWRLIAAAYDRTLLVPAPAPWRRTPDCFETVRDARRPVALPTLRRPSASDGGEGGEGGVSRVDRL